ncbi:hypothetical protein MHB77_08865 [Paenibacillus sp. FSL K6-3166]|uniref:hypothetical protein n=1 Tax=unclassified Paenibacillus TaxID=185978 RepID=UPI000B9FC6A6|nr:hypothetical protein [Paenibacillus sp. VTT E-133291]MBY3618555.1 hypothetical protein [Acinetobacter sp. CUI P1]OZQ97270.1 hypothetical protein CA598_06855 [Paenibacillus sp. VTT E-133291]
MKVYRSLHFLNFLLLLGSIGFLTKYNDMNFFIFFLSLGVCLLLSNFKKTCSRLLNAAAFGLFYHYALFGLFFARTTGVETLHWIGTILFIILGITFRRSTIWITVLTGYFYLLSIFTNNPFLSFEGALDRFVWQVVVVITCAVSIFVYAAINLKSKGVGTGSYSSYSHSDEDNFSTGVERDYDAEDREIVAKNREHNASMADMERRTGGPSWAVEMYDREADRTWGDSLNADWRESYKRDNGDED